MNIAAERPVLLACGLVREFGKTVRTRVLHGVDITIRRGEFLALTGPSGSGKSTLLYLLGALDRPTAGTVMLDGADLGGLRESERADLRGNKIGFVFQFHFLLPEFSVLENVMLPILRARRCSRADAKHAAARTLDALGLSDLSKRRPHQLSGGQQQRVAIARAVANDPRIILADEPTGNLDSKNGHVVVEIFRRLVEDQGRTVVMVTHEGTFAAMASRQTVLCDGHIVEDIDQRTAARPQGMESAT
ncbi:MAG TPA: ABC transporter ATP-binding protein [Polyangiaceae bacterium]|jgi:lipoprotein-releasing system ATP-binding protein|nr:ABC transporter ATP-binding protein [Polyangiaceae bacterium]